MPIWKRFKNLEFRRNVKFKRVLNILIWETDRFLKRSLYDLSIHAKNFNIKVFIKRGLISLFVWYTQTIRHKSTSACWKLYPEGLKIFEKIWGGDYGKPLFILIILGHSSDRLRIFRNQWSGRKNNTWYYYR